MSNTPNTTVIQLVISGFVDSREVVNKLNEFYANTGVVISQRAKYERPTWFYILSVLGRRPMTVQQIVDKLKTNNINTGYYSVLRFLKVMMNTEEAIHPHRRNCGISCHELVADFGGVIQNKCAIHTNEKGAPFDTYHLGGSAPSVNYFRRVYNVYVNP
jgi:hypothetical protein